MGDLQGERDSLGNLAETERKRNNLGEARDYLEKAIELTESLRAKPFARNYAPAIWPRGKAITSCTRTC